MNNKTFEYKGIKYSHIGRGQWIIDFLLEDNRIDSLVFKCEQDLKNFIDTKFFNIDLINK